MCRSARCPNEDCSGLTWIGCGLHVPSVMDPVPKEDWCTCPKPENSTYPPQGVLIQPALPSFRELEAARKIAEEQLEAARMRAEEQEQEDRAKHANHD
ncbi:hypothetical protein DFH27DRAFT_560947 [Peziza echinospora]|nr:hypothetical protein DFH27DRAFT_560947 [Peziza echinospora]